MKQMIFKRFERFWHWSQALLIITMMLTGFEVHGTYSLFGFNKAIVVHEFAAYTLMGLWVFVIFWHLVTGEWRQYIPTTEKLAEVTRFYFIGIFKGETHPYTPTLELKHNPLQRLAYLSFKLMMAPLMWVTGLLLLFYSSWESWGLGFLDLGVVSFFHILGAFTLIAFLIGHVYMTTTGPTVFSHIKAMITGYHDDH